MARKLEIEIVGDASSLQRALGRAGKQTDSFGSKLGGLAKGAGIAAGAAGIAGLAYAVKVGIGEFAQAQKVTAQTNAVIKSTGNVANITTKGVQSLANSLMKKSGVDDEAIQSGENLIATFTNIRNESGKGRDIFDQTTKAALDMSVALGTDVTNSAMQLGKALNDPAKGLAKLQKQGVSFTDGQKELIKSLQASGDTLGAQKVILKEVNKEFGGSAEAVGKTLPGMINIAKESFNNWMGELVAKTIPVLQEVIGWLRDHWPEISAALKSFWAQVKPIVAGILSLWVSVVDTIREHWSTIGPMVTNVAREVQAVMKIIAAALRLVIDLLHGDWAKAWGDIKDIGRNAFNALKAIVTNELLLLKAVFLNGGTALKNALVNGLEGIGSAAWGVVNNIGAVISSFAGRIAGWGLDVGRHLVSGILDGLSGIGSRVVSLIRSAVNHVIDTINRALEFDVSVNTHVPGVGKVGFRVDPPDIPHLAVGVRNFAGGLAVVGEQGPELVSLPGGASVTPMGGGLGSAGGTVVHVHYHGTIIQERDAAKTIATMLNRERARGNPMLLGTG